MNYPCCTDDSQGEDPHSRVGVSGAVRGNVDYMKE